MRIPANSANRAKQAIYKGFCRFLLAFAVCQFMPILPIAPVGGYSPSLEGIAIQIPMTGP